MDIGLGDAAVDQYWGGIVIPIEIGTGIDTRVGAKLNQIIFNIFIFWNIKFKQFELKIEISDSININS